MNKLFDDLNWAITDYEFKMNDKYMDGFYQFEYKKRLAHLRKDMIEVIERLDNVLKKAPKFTEEYERELNLPDHLKEYV